VFDDPAALALGDSQDRGLVLVEMPHDAADHLPPPHVNDGVASAKGAERIDAAHGVLLGDLARAAAEAGDEAEELAELEEAAVARARADADVDDLDAELVLPVREAEELGPPAAPARAREWVHADRGAHVLEGVPEGGVARDGGAVRRCEAGERGAELGELGVEVGYLGLGEGCGELGERALGLLFALKGGETNAAESVHDLRSTTGVESFFSWLYLVIT
jgi:hypothetical protein